MIFSDDDVKIKLPCNILVSGPSGSGKSVWIMNLVKNYKNLITPIPQNIVYAYGIYNDIVPLMDTLGVKTVAGSPESVLKSLNGSCLLILDDLQTSLTEEYLNWLFLARTHHENICCVTVVQNLFAKNIKSARQNCHYIVLLNGVAYRLQVRILGSQLFPGQSNFFSDAYNQTMSEKYASLFIDLHPRTPEALRLRGNIFPDSENIVFLPK